MPIYTAIELEHVTRRFGSQTAVDALSLRVATGSIFALLGPNGAGKSTTMRMLAGLLPAQEGQIRIFEKEINPDDLERKRSTGVLLDGLGLFEDLTIGEHLDLTHRLYAIDEAAYAQRSEELLRCFELQAAAQRPVRNGSYGMRKKTALAMALLPNPALLLLDEPFEGLDPVMATALKSALRRAATAGTTVFITTHMLRTVDDLATDFGILREGHLVAAGTLAALRAQQKSLEEIYLSHFVEPNAESFAWLG